ncbi:hypothetical protein H6CHR_04224 [Variovorax sp. PBL-H6]|uniref:hypothetical protein n=1 Tax=Variovorax sp. PBL-H6 TaxID=434009 RepID=UPI001317EB47|nr:hypothetical protein [Variovorax sp. PBL-H6]VTU34528.1 hypothetical protein H6CHR_04224 [Variovorax sp. PBL-H6]
MTHSVLIFLFKAGDHCAPVDRAFPPIAVLHARSDSMQHGENGLFVSGAPMQVQAIQLAGGARTEVDSFGYDFRYFSPAQRQVSDAATLRLQAALDRLQPHGAPAAPGLVPMVMATAGPEHLTFYRYVQQGEPGAVYLQYHRAPPQPNLPWGELVSLLQAGQPRLAQAWPLLNDDCWFSKWRSDIEMERKFTFEGIPDTWQLINQLYDEVLDRKLAGYVPELDRDFQVFDYESHIFEVSGDPDEAGYISFIPQADGRMTLKRKWFIENAEIRRETVAGNLNIELGQAPAHVRTMTTAKVRRLPAFRRKRFDVNFESLRTGNVYGVYFDICRTTSPRHAFAQCEVEYCRTRTFHPLRDVMEEFEHIADYVKRFLERKQIAFRHDTFSKLDFVREAQALAQTQLATS